MDTLCSDLRQLCTKQLKASESCLCYLDQNIDHQLYLNVKLLKRYGNAEIEWSYCDRFKVAVDNDCTAWILEILSILDNDTALCYCIENKLEWLFDRYAQIQNYPRIAHCYLVNGYYDQYKRFERLILVDGEYSQAIAYKLGLIGKDFFTKPAESFFLRHGGHCYTFYVRGLASEKHLGLLRKEILTINEYCDYIEMVYILAELREYEIQLEFAQHLELVNCYSYSYLASIARDLVDPNYYNCPQLLQYLIELHEITDVDDLLEHWTLGPA